VIRKLIVGLVMTSALTIGLSIPAFADPGCYTGCQPGPVSIVDGGPSISPGVPAPRESVPPPGGLPITGEDIAQSVGIGAVLLVAGVAIVRVSRRKARPTS
jgi:hypothetical protein